MSGTKDKVVDTRPCAYCKDKFPMRYAFEDGLFRGVYEIIGNYYYGSWLCDLCVNMERKRILKERRLKVVA